MAGKEKLTKEDKQILIIEIRKNFLAQLSLLKGLCGEGLKERAKETRIVIASACATGTAVWELGDKPDYFYAELMMLSRSFIEKITNFCYLQVCSEIEYKKFHLYPYYRAFHNTDRKKTTKSGAIYLKYSGKEELKNNEKVHEALSIFSEKDHTKKWSDLNIDKKVAVIAEKTKLKTEFFLINTLSIYSDASEALHGTLYGCALPTGAYTPGINIKDYEQAYGNLYLSTALLYAQLGSIIHETIILLSDTVDIKFSEYSIKNQEVGVSILQAFD